jgi:ribosomal protein L7Ae-like RNA K-turn-binding protein
MDKALNFLALAKKGRLAELGEEPVGAITRTGKGYLVIVASDASDHTWRRAKSFVAGTNQQCIRVKFTKEELGFVVGRTSLAIAAITDAPMALALVKALGEPEKYKDCLAALEEKSQKLKKRQSEAKAHQKNVRMGKVKK